MKFIKDITEGDNINGIYLVKSKSSALTKTGKEYFSLSLQDKTGSVDAKIWDVNSPSINDFENGDFVEINAQASVFNNVIQLKVERLRVAKKDEYNPADFFICSKRDLNEMLSELDDYIQSVKHEGYKKVLNEIFVNNVEFRDRFIKHQGGKAVHHGFVNGLLEHTLSVTKIAKAIALSYNDVKVDLVITACLLHDIGKVFEIESYPINDYTDEGHLLGHIMIGYSMVKEAIEKVAPEIKTIAKTELLHCILSHHGELEYGSPKIPSIMEAFIVSNADFVDSKIQIIREGIDNSKITGKTNNFGFLGYNKYLGTDFRETSKD